MHCSVWFHSVESKHLAWRLAFSLPAIANVTLASCHISCPVPAPPLLSTRACPMPCDLPRVRDPSAPPQGGWAAVGPPQLMLDAGVLIRAQHLPGRDAPSATHLPQVPGSPVRFPSGPQVMSSQPCPLGPAGLSCPEGRRPQPAMPWGGGCVERGPGFGCKHPRSGGALSKPPSSASIPRLPWAGHRVQETAN